jgi:hypothetical protein
MHCISFIGSCKLPSFSTDQGSINRLCFGGGLDAEGSGKCFLAAPISFDGLTVLTCSRVIHVAGNRKK